MKALRLFAALFALLATPALAQTAPWQPQYYAVAIADDSGIGGVISYRIGADGKLDGRFALHGSDGRIERETAAPRKRGLAGVYDTRGVSQGEAYTGVLTIAPIGPASGGEGELYRLSWDNGDRGVGIRSGQTLTVAFGQNGDTVGMLFSTAPDRWSVVAIGWRGGAERRIGLSWSGALQEGNLWAQPLAGGVREQLRLAPNGATWRLHFDDGNYGVAMPVPAPVFPAG
jgi:hypothetical protein